MIQPYASENCLNSISLNRDCLKNSIVAGAAVIGFGAACAPLLTGLTVSGGAVFGLSMGITFASATLIEKARVALTSQLSERIGKIVKTVFDAAYVASYAVVPFYITNLACSRFASLGSITFSGALATTAAPLVLGGICYVAFAVWFTYMCFSAQQQSSKKPV